jgi:hypothetical protein
MQGKLRTGVGRRDFSSSDASKYDSDLYTWAQAQAAHLWAKQWEALDINHPAEEIDSLGNEQEHAVESHLKTLALHLLKVAYQRQRRMGWLRGIDNARDEIEQRLRRSPSLRPKLPQVLAWAYPKARPSAARETKLPRDTFSDTCPWTLEQPWMRAFCRRSNDPWQRGLTRRSRRTETTVASSIP